MAEEQRPIDLSAIATATMYHGEQSPLNKSQENVKPPSYPSGTHPGYVPYVTHLTNSYDETSLRHRKLQSQLHTSQENVMQNYSVFNDGSHAFNTRHPELYPGNMNIPSGYTINQQQSVTPHNFPPQNNFPNQPPYSFYPQTPNPTNFSNDNFSEQRLSPRQAWLPDGCDMSGSTSQTGQRKSLDETINRNLMNVGYGVVASNFQRQHRRGRSDDAGKIMSAMNPNYGYEPRFHSPPPVRSMQMSQSTTSLENIGYNNPSTRLPHSMSMDTPALYNSMVHEKLYAQSAAYVNLTTAIKLAQRKFKEVEDEVKCKEIELNKLLSVQKNPTEKEHNQLKAELSILHREIEQICQECDRLGIPIDPSCDEKPAYMQYMQPPVTPVQTPSPTNHKNTPDTSFQRQQPFASYSATPTSSPQINVIPNPAVITQQPPAYETIKDPVPQYSPYTPDPMRPSPRIDPNRPPPLPPRPFVTTPQLKPSPPPNTASNECRDNEHWVCPQCTFKNLLVAECEVCFTPRPPRAQ